MLQLNADFYGEKRTAMIILTAYYGKEHDYYNCLKKILLEEDIYVQA